MMDAIKNVKDFGSKTAIASLLDGGDVTTIEPVWTQIGSRYVTSIQLLIKILKAGDMFSLGTGNATSPWAKNLVNRLSLIVTPMSSTYEA